MADRQKMECPGCGYKCVPQWLNDEATCLKCFKVLRRRPVGAGAGAGVAVCDADRRQCGEASTFKQAPGSAMERESTEFCSKAPKGVHLFRFGKCSHCNAPEPPKALARLSVGGNRPTTPARATTPVRATTPSRPVTPQGSRGPKRSPSSGSNAGSNPGSRRPSKELQPILCEDCQGPVTPGMASKCADCADKDDLQMRVGTPGRTERPKLEVFHVDKDKDVVKLEMLHADQGVLARPVATPDRMERIKIDAPVQRPVATPERNERSKVECPHCGYKSVPQWLNDQAHCLKCQAVLKVQSSIHGDSKFKSDVLTVGDGARRKPGEVSTFKTAPGDPMLKESPGCMSSQTGNHLWKFGKCEFCGKAEGQLVKGPGVLANPGSKDGGCSAGGKCMYKFAKCTKCGKKQF